MTAAGEMAAAFLRIAEERRTVRVFTDAPVPAEVLDRCLDSARQMASSSNLQPWEFVIVEDPALRTELNRILFDQQATRTAPLLIAVVAHPERWKAHSAYILDTLKERGILRKSQSKYWGGLIPLIYRSGPFGCFGWVKRIASRLVSCFRPTPNLYSRGDIRVLTHKSTALGAASLMLALRAEGYDSCPMEGFDPWRAKRALKLPRRAEVCMFLAVGKRAEAGAIWWDRILVPRDWVVRKI